MKDYLPKSEAELLTWATGFSAKVAQSPSSYGLSAEASQEVSAAVEAYAQAFEIARSPATRTKGKVAAKNQAKAAMVRLLRSAAQQIRSNPAISDTLKVDLNIRLPGRAPNAVPELSERPFLNLRAVQPRRHVIGYSNGEGHGRAKPRGAIGLQLFVHVGESAPADPLDARFLRFMSSQPCAVDFKSEQVGKTAFYFARWQTLTGDVGPWSQVLRMTVAG